MSTDSFDYSTYLSPFTVRYGTKEMRAIWSEENRRRLWRKVWVAIATVEHEAGIVTKDELADITSHQNDIDISLSRKREEKVYHELMAEIQIFSEQCKTGGGKIHLGATSTDILDNTTTMQIISSLNLVRKNLLGVLTLFAEKIKQYDNVVCIGYTHLQPAEPTTLSYRLAFYAQDLLLDLEFLDSVQPLIKGKGLKGAVGTSASFDELLKHSTITPQELEKKFASQLGIDVLDIANQTYPRKLDLFVIETLANIAASINKFCFDYRILQSPLYGEWMEKRNTERVGSSAMPFKRNPDRAEKVCSLCRYVSGFLSTSWSNPANSLLERTLDDSASQRLFLPEAFLAIDDCLKNTSILLKNLEINEFVIQKNLKMFGPFAATEPLLMEIVKRGGNRQEAHEIIKTSSMKAWAMREKGESFSLSDLLLANSHIASLFSLSELTHFLEPSIYTGLAKQKSRQFLQKLKKEIIASAKKFSVPIEKK